MRATIPILAVVSRASSSSTPARAPRSDAERPRGVRRLRRLPWVPLVITALVLISALFAVPPIRDAATGAAVEEARLVIPSAYLVLSPLFDVLDTLTLLSVGQHIALLITLILCWVLWRAWPRKRVAVPTDVPPTRGRRVAREALLTVGFLAGLVLLYAAMALMPRPMARLVLTDLDIVAVDVHAHTQYSHDGRAGWTPDRLRRWASDAGYDAVYISDHRTMEGVTEGISNNPAEAGQGTVLLPALEVVWRGERVNVLSFGSTYAGITDAALRDIDDRSLELASLIRGKEPLLVQTIPADLSKLSPAHGPGTAGIRAIEVVDGGPRGLGQTRRDRARIIKLADSLDLALVSGSDNHGYGRAAPGWTLFRLPGWRSAAPAQLAEVMETVLRKGGRPSTRVAERVVASADGPLQLVLTAPLVFWRMLTTLSFEQRLMWVIWTWAVTLVLVTWRVGRARRAARA